MKNTDKFQKVIFYLFDRQNASTIDTGISPTINLLPEWYMNAKKYLDDHNGTPTFKACISFFDSMSFGYSFVLPADLTVSVEDGVPKLHTEEKYQKLFQERQPMHGFSVPDGYYESHFAFIPEWGMQLPKGYSALYVSPLNRFDLPFLMTSGVIENDEFFSPGAMPFFIRKNFSGTIPKGTPIAQIIPFKRENWESEVRHLDDQKYHAVMTINNQDLRGIKSGGYRNKYWLRKIFK